MNTRSALALATVTVVAGLGATACSTTSTESGVAQDEQTTSAQEQDHSSEATSDTNGDHSHAGHESDGGPAPEGIVEAVNPTYPVGTEVVLSADHMPGMDGAKAKIVGAYQTTTYSVDYMPTDGGNLVKDHKWVVQEELEGAGGEVLPDGAEATILADHMPGMKGATGTVVSSTDETVYMVDVDADGTEMKNHKWVVESEIQPL